MNRINISDHLHGVRPRDFLLARDGRHCIIYVLSTKSRTAIIMAEGLFSDIEALKLRAKEKLRKYDQPNPAKI